MGGGHREPKVGIVYRNKTATKGGKAYTLTASYDGAVAWNSIEKKQRTMIPVGRGREKRNDYLHWRKLTPKECERLQTVKDDWTLVPHPVYENKMMSNTQRYKMLGNGWTIEVIKHILNLML